MKHATAIIGLATLILLTAPGALSATAMNKQTYQRSAALADPASLTKLVMNGFIAPNWIRDTDRFWYF